LASISKAFLGGSIKPTHPKAEKYSGTLL